MTGRKLAVVIGAAAAVLLMLCGLGVALLAWFSAELGVVPKWTVVHSVPAQFHVKAAAGTFHFRESGFQDPRYELLFEVRDVAKFLEENGLVRGGETTPGVNDAPVKADRALELDGLVSDQLYRSGQLWDCGGTSWVYLVAFGT